MLRPDMCSIEIEADAGASAQSISQDVAGGEGEGPGAAAHPERVPRHQEGNDQIQPLKGECL